jgi:hypothetical protein
MLAYKLMVTWKEIIFLHEFWCGDPKFEYSNLNTQILHHVTEICIEFCMFSPLIFLSVLIISVNRNVRKLCFTSHISIPDIIRKSLFYISYWKTWTFVLLFSKIDLWDTGYEDVNWTELVQHQQKWQASEFHKSTEFTG